MNGPLGPARELATAWASASKVSMSSGATESGPTARTYSANT